MSEDAVPAAAEVPSVLSILLCDHIIIEQGTGKKTLVGLFDVMNATRWLKPARQNAEQFAL
jgi:hypothetical protein